jgi:hypothetical protein
MDTEKIVHDVAERVRVLVADAEKRAEEIVTQAQAEAERIRAKAEAEARERLDQVREALEKLEAGLGAKPAPDGSNRDSQAPQPEPEPEAPAPEPEAPESKAEASEPQPAPAEPAPSGKVSTEALIEQLKAGGQSAEPDPEPAAQATNAAPGDDAGAARLVAMKLALDGTSRDEARKQLAADYDVADLDSLLDEVYSKAGK